MIHPLWGESEFRSGHGACHGELSAEGEKFLREHLHPDYFFDQNGSFLRKMSVWKPSPSIYITYQEPEYDKKIKFSQKSPEIALWRLLGDPVLFRLAQREAPTCNSLSCPLNLLFLQFRRLGLPPGLHRAQLIHLFRGSEF